MSPRHFLWWHVTLVMSHHIHSYLFIYRVSVLWHSFCHNVNMWQSHVADMSCVATSCVSENALGDISCRRHSQLSWAYQHDAWILILCHHSMQCIYPSCKGHAKTWLLLLCTYCIYTQLWAFLCRLFYHYCSFDHASRQEDQSNYPYVQFCYSISPCDLWNPYHHLHQSIHTPC